MCLFITQTKPLSKSPFRYKILQKVPDVVPLRSPFLETYWDGDKIDSGDIKPYNNGLIARYGIHVCQTRKEAEFLLKQLRKDSSYWDKQNLKIVRIRVSGFLGAGKLWNFGANCDGQRGEVWKRARIVKVYD